MKVLSGVLALVIVVAILIVAGWGAYALIGDFLKQYRIMPPMTKTIIGFSVVLLSVAVFILVLGIRSAARQMLGASLGGRRVQVYHDLLVHCQQLAQEEGVIDAVNALRNRLETHRVELFLLAGNNVLAAIAKLELRLGNAEEPQDAVRSSSRSLVKAMRRDLGQSASLEETQFLRHLF